MGLDGVTPDERAVVTVGTFDGVHIGHQRIIRYVAERARATGGSGTVVTFDPHPREVMSGSLVPLLTTLAERQVFLRELGADRIVVIPFTREFAATTSADFVRDVICDRIGCAEIVVGYDHAFGRGRGGDVATLKEAAEELGFVVEAFPAESVGGAVVSSSAIRRLIAAEGDVRSAGSMLGRWYSLDGRVVHGEGRGKAIGFPTANVEVVSIRKVIPRRGVYAVTVAGPEEGGLPGMMNIGVRPTFGGNEDVHLEVHLIDYDGDLYGETLHIEFVERLRDERRFGSVDDLREQLSRDRRRCREALASVS